MPDLIEDSRDKTVTRDGQAMMVTLVNPRPRVYENNVLGACRLISGLIVESAPAKDDPAKTVTRIYSYGDTGAQDIKGSPQYAIIQSAKLCSDETHPTFGRSHEAQKAKWAGRDGGRAYITLIGEFGDERLHEITIMLDKLRDDRHFGHGFEEKALEAVRQTRFYATGEQSAEFGSNLSPPGSATRSAKR